MDHYHHEDSTPLPSPLSRFKIKESLIEEEANEKKKSIDSWVVSSAEVLKYLHLN